MDSYDEILGRMKEKYYELSGRAIPPLSDIDIRMKVLAGEIFSSEVNLDFIKRQMFPSTALGEYLDLHAADRGMTRKAAVKSRGELRFSVSAPAVSDINIPEGTVASTSGNNSVRFVTTEPAAISAGNTLVSVEAEAMSAGSSGNVARESINTLVTSVMGVESVTNPDAFSGGADRETDEELRKRVLSSYISISNGTNKEYYRRLALSVDGVKSAGVTPRRRGVGTVDVFICSEGPTVTTALINSVQEVMDRERELNVDVLVSAAVLVRASFGIRISVRDGYSHSETAERVKASVREYIDSLGVGENVLESRICTAIMSTEGVYDFEWMTNYPTAYSVNDNSRAVYDGMIVGVMS